MCRHRDIHFNGLRSVELGVRFNFADSRQRPNEESAVFADTGLRANLSRVFAQAAVARNVDRHLNRVGVLRFDAVYFKAR